MTLGSAGRPTHARTEKGGVLLKVLLIGTALMVVAGVVVTAGLLFVGYRVKNAVAKAVDAERTREAPRPVAARVEAAAPRPSVCSLLTQREASEILGVAVERVRSTDRATDSM